jgi:hypothetical protein
VRRALYPLAVLVVAAAIGVWAFVAGGRESIAFLVLATIALGWVVWLLFRIRPAAQGARAREAGAAEGAQGARLRS